MSVTTMEQERYCVFSASGGRFGLPALSLKQVAPRPLITPVPASHPVLLGLAHVRNEFLPAFSLRTITEFEEQSRDTENQLLVINSVNGSWGLLIDRTIAVTPLETSFSSLERRGDRWSQVMTGAASYREHVVQILEPTALLQFLVSKLNEGWDFTSEHTSPEEMVEAGKQ